MKKFILLILIFYLISIIDAIIINNENDLLDELSKNENEVVINITSELTIFSNITINSSINRISIIGETLLLSKLNLYHQFVFDENVKEIEIRNLSIEGDLNFNNNEKVTIDSVNLYGNVNSNFDSDSNNDYINISNVNYYPSIQANNNCINLSGNVNIFNSSFYGNSSCENRLIEYNGMNKYKFMINNSYFNGNNQCPFLSIENGLNVNINVTKFENGYSSDSISGG